MDKNTIIGLLLITAIIVAFTIYNRPSKEQIAEQKRLRDSIALVEAQQAEIATELGSKQASTSLSDDSVLGQGSSLSDFFRAGTPYNEAINDSTSEVTILANEPVNEEIVVLENDKIRLLLNTKGGKIQSVQLKEYLHYKGDSLYLFENDQESRFNLELFNRNSLRISTENEYFTPIKSADGKTVIMRLQNSSEQYIDLVYTLPEDEYMLDFDIRISGMRNGLHPESLANFKLNWEQKVRQQEKGRAFENRYSRIHYKYDVSVGSRYSTGVNVVNWPMGRVLMSYFASKYVRIITGLKVHDTTAGFVCYRRKVLETIDLDNIKFKGYAFQIEMKYSASYLGFKVKEVSVIFVNRRLGTSKMNTSIFGEAFFGVIILRWRSFTGKIKPKVKLVSGE
jgi:hypothetical protein